MSKYTLAIQPTYIPVSLAEAFVCGGVSGEFRFSAKITALGLDARGFVLDVKEVLAGIRNAYDPSVTFKASCEELCNGIVNVIMTHAVEAGVRLEEVAVRVHNLTGYVELVVGEDDVTPTFPKRATARQKAEPRQRSSC